MMKVNILIVEDTESDIQLYQDAIKDINLEFRDKLEIVPSFANDKKSGLLLLNQKKDELDGAFIDLKLTKGAPVDVNEGNDFVEEIYGKLRFPLVIFTNTPGGFNQKFPQSLFLQVLTKTDVLYRDVILELVKIAKTGITKILGKKGLIESMLDQIFWNNISHTLPEWLVVDKCEKPLLRYSLTHLQEHLEIADDGLEFDIVYPMENYIKPSIKPYFFTGDIVLLKSDRSKRFLIMNPACDLAPHGEKKKPKASHVILSELQEFSATPLNSAIRKAKSKLPEENDPEKEAKVKEIERARDTIMKTISNNHSPQFYYLPNTTLIKGGLVNFQKLLTVKYSDMSSYEKEATVTAGFIKDIIAKFSFYYSRQGSPDFDFQTLVKEHTK